MRLCGDTKTVAQDLGRHTVQIDGTADEAPQGLWRFRAAARLYLQGPDEGGGAVEDGASGGGRTRFCV